MKTEEQQIAESIGTERLFAGLVSAFGGIAALLAAIGLYGVMAYSVARRTVEIGIRLALGAPRSTVQWMVPAPKPLDGRDRPRAWNSGGAGLDWLGAEDAILACGLPIRRASSSLRC